MVPNQIHLRCAITGTPGWGGGQELLKGVSGVHGQRAGATRRNSKVTSDSHLEIDRVVV